MVLLLRYCQFGYCLHHVIICEALKIGVIAGLAVGILFAMPEMKLPAITNSLIGTGPVFAGSMFPFLFITIACGAISGFHALVSSGTTPKLVNNERDIRMIGYGGMLMESFVGDHGLDLCGQFWIQEFILRLTHQQPCFRTRAESAAEAVRTLGFVVTPEALTLLTRKWVRTRFYRVLVVRLLLQLVWHISLRKFLIAVK